MFNSEVDNLEVCLFMYEFSARNDIERSIKELKINRDEFFEISKFQWQEIQNKVIEHFVNKKHYTNDLHWAWERLKEPYIGLRFKKDDAYKHIADIVNEEYVWFIADDGSGKMWIYEGKPHIISEIIADSYNIDEYYIVSKKYEWLLCENHHNFMCGSGEKIVNQINKFKSQRTDIIF